MSELRLKADGQPLALFVGDVEVIGVDRALRNITGLSLTGPITGVIAGDALHLRSNGGITATIWRAGADNSGPIIRGRKSLGTVDAAAAAATNSILVRFIGEGHTGSTFEIGGEVRVQATNSWSESTRAALMAFFTRDGASLTERMRITDRLLIGTTTVGNSGAGGIRAIGASQFDAAVRVASLLIGATTVIDASRVLQNVTADAGIITAGTFGNDRISEASVTQHQAALSIGASQITGLRYQFATLTLANDTPVRLDSLFTHWATGGVLLVSASSGSSPEGNALDSATIAVRVNGFNAVTGGVGSIFSNSSGTSDRINFFLDGGAGDHVVENEMGSTVHLRLMYLNFGLP